MRAVALHSASEARLYASRHPLLRKEFAMLDLLMLALGLGFFALTVGYAYACERL
jgi:hypothetical protein